MLLIPINEINRPLKVAVKSEVLYSYLIIIYFIIITDSIERPIENISVADIFETRPQC